MIDPAIGRKDVNARATAHLTTAQISAVEWTTILINAFNRISIVGGHPVLAPIGGVSLVGAGFPQITTGP